MAHTGIQTRPPDNFEAGEQTGAVPTESIELTASSLSLECEGKSLFWILASTLFTFWSFSSSVWDHFKALSFSVILYVILSASTLQPDFLKIRLFHWNCASLWFNFFWNWAVSTETILAFWNQTVPLEPCHSAFGLTLLEDLSTGIMLFSIRSNFFEIGVFLMELCWYLVCKLLRHLTQKKKKKKSLGKMEF